MKGFAWVVWRYKEIEDLLVLFHIVDWFERSGNRLHRRMVIHIIIILIIFLLNLKSLKVSFMACQVKLLISLQILLLHLPPLLLPNFVIIYVASRKLSPINLPRRKAVWLLSTNFSIIPTILLIVIFEIIL